MKKKYRKSDSNLTQHFYFSGRQIGSLCKKSSCSLQEGSICGGGVEFCCMTTQWSIEKKVPERGREKMSVVEEQGAVAIFRTFFFHIFS